MTWFYEEPGFLFYNLLDLLEGDNIISAPGMNIPIFYTMKRFLLVLFLWVTGSSIAFGQWTDSVYRDGRWFYFVPIEDGRILLKDRNGVVTDTLTYYGDNDTSLYNQLKTGYPIIDAYIEKLDWAQIAESIEVPTYNSYTKKTTYELTLNITEPVIFFNVIVKELAAPVDKTKPYRPYKFEFQSAVIFDRCLFISDAPFNEMTFLNQVHFNFTDFLGVTDFENCNFLSLTDFQTAEFRDWAKFSKSKFHTETWFVSTIFHKYADFKFCRLSKNTVFERATFEEYVNLSYLEIIDSFPLKPFKDTSGFSYRLYIGEKYATRQGQADYFKLGPFEKAYFGENCHILIDDDIAKLGIRLEDWNRVWIEFPFEFGYVEKRHLLDNVIEYINKQTNARRVLVDDVLNRLEYQITRLDMNYGSFLVRAKLWFFEVVTHNGYRGTCNFLLTASAILGLFTFIYFKKCQNQVDLFIYRQKFVTDYPHPVLGNRSGKILRLIRALWFSLLIFLTFRLRREYFKFSRGLQTLVLIEWLVGLGMFIMYFFFFASKYAFIKALLGI